jgi:hypothetical protein
MHIQDILYLGLFGSGFHFGWEPLIGTIFTTGKFFWERVDGDVSHNMGNFGIFTWWDYLMGTDQKYLEWKKSQKKL